ncbi:MAG: hypothetical protein R3C12_04640 [Planctomycetaceae bacterium]
MRDRLGDEFSCRRREWLLASLHGAGVSLLGGCGKPAARFTGELLRPGFPWAIACVLRISRFPQQTSRVQTFGKWKWRLWGWHGWPGCGLAAAAGGVHGFLSF